MPGKEFFLFFVLQEPPVADSLEADARIANALPHQTFTFATIQKALAFRFLQDTRNVFSGNSLHPNQGYVIQTQLLAKFDSLFAVQVRTSLGIVDVKDVELLSSNLILIALDALADQFTLDGKPMKVCRDHTILNVVLNCCFPEAVVFITLQIKVTAANMEIAFKVKVHCTA